MKKVLYISYDGMTDPLGQSQVIPYLEGLTKEGYAFTILSFEKKDRLAKSGKDIQSLLDRSGIKWVPQLFSTRPPFFSKLYDLWKMKRRARALHRKEGFSFIHCRSYVAAAAGLSLYKSEQLPFLFDMRGFWVDERVDNGQWDLSKPWFRWFYNVYKKKEKQYLQYAREVISLTHKGKEELVNTYKVPAAKIAVIACCADLEHFDYNRIGAPETEKAKEDLGIATGDRVLTYLGSLGGWYLTDEMLDFFTALRKKTSPAKFLFITQDDRAAILKKAESKGIPAADIIVQPAQRKNVPLYLSVSDWSIFFIKDAYSKKASSPTKQGEIMAMGIPIFCNDIGDTGRIIEHSSAGVVLHDLSEDAYKKAIDRLADIGKTSRQSIREGAFEHYDLNTGTSLYVSVYKKMIG